MEKTIKLSTFAAHGLLTLSVAVLGIACSSCTVEPTALTEENLPVKSIICGHVRYSYTKDQGGAVTEAGKPGLTVNIAYGIPDATTGKVESYALRTVTTGQHGYFEYALGCPVGKALTVKVSASGYVDDAKGTPTTGSSTQKSKAYLYAEVEKSVTGGQAAYFAIDMTPAAYVGAPGLKQ